MGNGRVVGPVRRGYRPDDRAPRRPLGEDLQREFYKQVATVDLGYIYRLVAKKNWPGAI